MNSGVVWSTGKVPADWKGNGKGRPTISRPVLVNADQYHCSCVVGPSAASA